MAQSGKSSMDMHAIRGCAARIYGHGCVRLQCSGPCARQRPVAMLVKGLGHRQLGWILRLLKHARKPQRRLGLL